MSQGRLLPLPSGASGRRRTDLVERAVARARTCEWGAWGCGGRATRVLSVRCKCLPLWWCALPQVAVCVRGWEAVGGGPHAKRVSRTRARSSCSSKIHHARCSRPPFQDGVGGGQQGHTVRKTQASPSNPRRLPAGSGGGATAEVRVQGAASSGVARELHRPVGRGLAGAGGRNEGGGVTHAGGAAPLASRAAAAAC